MFAAALLAAAPLNSGGDMIEPREVTEVRLELLLRLSLRSSLGDTRKQKLFLQFSYQILVLHVNVVLC